MRPGLALRGYPDPGDSSPRTSSRASDGNSRRTALAGPPNSEAPRSSPSGGFREGAGPLVSHYPGSPGLSPPGPGVTGPHPPGISRTITMPGPMRSASSRHDASEHQGVWSAPRVTPTSDCTAPSDRGCSGRGLGTASTPSVTARLNATPVVCDRLVTAASATLIQGAMGSGEAQASLRMCGRGRRGGWHRAAGSRSGASARPPQRARERRAIRAMRRIT